MSAIDTFRRAMRRHEKRARRMGLMVMARELRRHRLLPDYWTEAGWRNFAEACGRRPRFFAYLAADAVARLRAGLAAEAQAEEEDRPYVCPGCHAVNAPCRPGCIDAEIEAQREHDRETWDLYGDEEEGAEDDDG